MLNQAAEIQTSSLLMTIVTVISRQGVSHAATSRTNTLRSLPFYFTRIHCLCSLIGARFDELPHNVGIGECACVA